MCRVSLSNRLLHFGNRKIVFEGMGFTSENNKVKTLERVPKLLKALNCKLVWVAVKIQLILGPGYLPCN